MTSQETRTALRSGYGTAQQQLRIGSLFSGIGGLDLGLEWAGVGSTVYQVEVDPLCQETLARHWPETERWGDVRDVDPADLPTADLVCGGFPCQGLSVANTSSRTGLHDPRSGLWWNMARVVEATRPMWVVVENVAHGWRGWLPTVRGELGRQGYETLPIRLEARHVGRQHVRSRLFVLAHADGFQLREHEQRRATRRQEAVRNQGQTELVEARVERSRRPASQPPVLAVADGLPRGLAGPTWRACGNAVVPQCAEVIGYMIRELIEAGAAATREEIA